MIVSVPLLLLLYFLFVPFLPSLTPFLVFLPFYIFFCVMFCKGSFLLLLHFCIFGMEVGWGWNADWIFSLLLIFHTHIYMIHLRIWDSYSGLLYWGFSLLMTLDWSVTLPLTFWYLPVLAMYLPPLPPDSNSCFTLPFYLIPTFPNWYMLARIDANALWSLMKSVDRLNGWWMICVCMTRFDFFRIFNLGTCQSSKQQLGTEIIWSKSPPHWTLTE